MEIKVMCGNCGEPVKVSPLEVKDSKIILTLDEEHVCFNSEQFALTDDTAEYED
jgi:hypothetical protein